MLFKLPFLSLLALTASALPLEEYSRSLETADFSTLSVTPAELDSLRFFVQYAGAAYCNSQNAAGARVVCGANACPRVEANQATTLASFRGDDTGIEGFVARDDIAGLIVLSIRGSNEILNWLTNIDFLFLNCDSLVRGCRTHSGFTRAWQGLRTPAVNAIRAARAQYPSYRVVVTGHSLGAAVATLAAAYLRAEENIPNDLYSYGAPRAGNAEFANFVSAQAGANWRLTHGADPVTRLPPILFGYRHTTPEHWLNGGPSNHIDYTANDIDVCHGIANTACNAGTSGLDVDAHGHYLHVASACSPKLRTAAFSSNASSEQELLEAKLNEWVRQDIEFVGHGGAE
ncbi:alpha/beta-hydrolase [Sodiomyces alkalinus F11]|uniref:Alpha/beta-hydrolase n=1 Tax=Sodiomyces alkalinus (strain CBS 110278 / VKM F-3762 / F11) TaxID=1314773 RepID=A0A3N2Q992_SODAK|nr:alpha/beta-hydrolase [Sodiomyces alkalinus F11]ROT43218.1 alpha/beta-hydrolase [Sodiomyces alkalinus F11]